MARNAEIGATAPKRGRPALKPGSPKRSSFNTRLRTETKEQLETEASIAGRSLSEEIEFRLEQSLRDQGAQGGRQLHGLLTLFVGAAEIIQERYGRSIFSDWESWLAAKTAWQALMRSVGPRPPPEYWKLVEQSSSLPRLHEAPEYPSLPISEGGLGGLLAKAEAAQSDEFKTQLVAYEEAMRAHQKKHADWVHKTELLRNEMQIWGTRITTHTQIGRDVAVEIFPAVDSEGM